MLSENKPVDWIFVFKFNGYNFNGFSGEVGSPGIFGGTFQRYSYYDKYQGGQQYCYASSENPEMQLGNGMCGATYQDPLGATFAQVYDTDDYNYLIWNDQFKGNPQPKSLGDAQYAGAPWGHSKGMVAWNDDGEGMVLQVTTPSWPAAGNKNHPRVGDGNTLGCIKDDDIMVSQHFFGLKLNKEDLIKVLEAAQNASISTDPNNIQIVKNGGPEDVQSLVKQLGQLSQSKKVTKTVLSSGIQLISKPGLLNVPPWQMISSQLDNVPLRVASWWETPPIPTTNEQTKISCWYDAPSSENTTGAVDIALTGTFGEHKLGLTGGMGRDYNHAKLGVSTDPSKPYSIFGDMNQQGALSPQVDPDSKDKSPTCWISQNARGGMFFVMDDAAMYKSLYRLLNGETSPLGSTKMPIPPGS
ncbi:MAG: hypothetical protein Crog4KO_08230 [Crocinitomicaceae bacterium]